MSDTLSHLRQTVTRRRVLAGALALGGAAVLRSGASPALAAPAGRLRLASALPVAEPSSKDLLAGLREGFSRAYPSGQVEIGTAQAAGNWFLNAGSWSHAVSLAEEDSVRRVLHVDFGENVRREDERHARITEIGASLWRANFAAGRWAARELGRTAVLAMSVRESGYDAADALRAGFESAGGTVVATHITHLPGAASTLDDVVNTVCTMSPDVILAAYSGGDALDLLRQRPRLGNAKLVGSGFFLSPAVVKAAGPLADGAYSVSPWGTMADSDGGAAARGLGYIAGRQLASLAGAVPADAPAYTLRVASGGTVCPLTALVWDRSAEEAEAITARILKTGWTTPYLQLAAEA